jgi:flagellar motor switch protein FliN/FliY
MRLMDDLKISPEELADLVSAGSPDDAPQTPPASAPDASAESASGGMTQEQIDAILAGGAAANSAPPPPPPPSSAPQAPPSTQAQARPQQQVTARPVQFGSISPAPTAGPGTNLDMLMGVTLRVTVELGRTKMTIEEILKLGPGSVIELEKLAGEPVDVLVNDWLIARGEVVVIDDRFGVRITDVIPPAQRINSM